VKEGGHKLWFLMLWVWVASGIIMRHFSCMGMMILAWCHVSNRKGCCCQGCVSLSLWEHVQMGRVQHGQEVVLMGVENEFGCV
jgi:hypothetical protein